MQINIRNIHGASVVVDAYPTGVPGLAVCRTAVFHNSLDRAWSLVHVPSGQRAATFFTRRGAISFARDIAPLTNWEVDESALARTLPAIIGQVREILRKYRA